MDRSSEEITKLVEEYQQKKKKGKKHLLDILSVFFAALFVFSSVMALTTYLEGKKAEDAFKDIREQVGDPIIFGEDEEKEYSKYTEYYSLYQANPDFGGWLKIENTAINYPVMYTPEDPEKYLRRAFDGTSSRPGTPFVGAGCTLDSNALILYGHNRKNNTMFGTLGYYKKESFYKETPTFTFTTIYEERTYEVFAAVETRVLFTDEDGYRYYYHTGDLAEDEFNELVNWMIKNSNYNTGVVPTFGDDLLLLSTCSYHVENGRFVVAAIRVK